WDPGDIAVGGAERESRRQRRCEVTAHDGAAAVSGRYGLGGDARREPVRGTWVADGRPDVVDRQRQTGRGAATGVLRRHGVSGFGSDRRRRTGNGTAARVEAEACG